MSKKPFKHTVLALLIYYILFWYTFLIDEMTMEERWAREFEDGDGAMSQDSRHSLEEEKGQEMDSPLYSLQKELACNFSPRL